MKLHVVAVGKLRPALRETCDDYLRRLGRFLPVAEREVREAGRADTTARQRDDEGRGILDALPAAATVVLLDQGGEGWTSEALAGRLDEWRIAARDVAFVIGGAVGVSPAVVARAGLRWSLGPLTLPHELARVVVVEQLYRASTILRGEPYHRGARST
jgi:23S rRNA (pseudouridine1915-N3)-methyltransferase